jgi:type I restriction enzyme, S subunit
MTTLSKIIENPISGEWGDEGDSISVIRTTNFTNEGKIDFSNVLIVLKKLI